LAYRRHREANQLTSGCPNFAFSTAILMVQAIAVSHPAPSAKH